MYFEAHTQSVERSRMSQNIETLRTWLLALIQDMCFQYVFNCVIFVSIGVFETVTHESLIQVMYDM